MRQLICRVCSNEIQQDRVVGYSAFCSCGHVMQLSNSRAERDNRNGSISLIFFSILLVGAIIHAINWDTYFITIIPLKVRQLGGLAKPHELKEIARICSIRKKNNCEIQALEKAFDLDNKDTDTLLRVGELYMASGKYHASTKTYSLYFKNGGKAESARYGLARSLGETGQFKDAKKQFHYILKRDQKSPQFKVARSYVELLIKNNDYSTAKGIIQEYRRAGPSSALFLEKEWKTINEKLSRQSDKRSTRGA